MSAYDSRMGPNAVPVDHVAPLEAVERDFYAFSKGWFAMSTRHSLAVLDLGRNAAKVFLFCCDHIKPGNRLDFPQAYIAEKLCLPASRVSEAVKVLRDRGYLLTRREAGRTWMYVNPMVAYRGSAASHRATIARLSAVVPAVTPANVIPLEV